MENTLSESPEEKQIQNHPENSTAGKRQGFMHN
jgi:hypothetical protein